MAAWYLTYATFRNLKSFVPFVNLNNYDDELASIDRAIFFGRDPADLLHDVLGTGFTAQVMSAVYLVWIFLVPVSIAIALVWTRHTRAGSWYVTAVAFDWMLGAVIYLMLPTVGPIYSDPNEFTDLPHTYATWLSEQLLDDRVAVLADPWAAGTMQTIAAFASLHVGIMMTICLVAELVRLPRWVRIASWCFLAMTCISTVYLGWHFFVDVLGGMALGAFAVWLGAHGHRQPGRPATAAQGRGAGAGACRIARESLSARTTLRASLRPPRSGLSSTTPRVISQGLARTAAFSPYLRCTANRLRYM